MCARRIHGGGSDPILSAFRPPAIRSPGELADKSPVIDIREQEPLTFERLTSVRGPLITGDYSVAGLRDIFSIERADTISWRKGLVPCL
jgi:hypothetical protein